MKATLSVLILEKIQGGKNLIIVEGEDWTVGGLKA